MEFEVLKSRDGLYDIYSVNKLLLHSKYKPIGQAKEKAKLEYKERQVHIIFGYGNGYLIEALKKQFKYNEILIVLDPLVSRKYIHPTTDYEHEYIFNSEWENIPLFLNGLEALEHQSTINLIFSFNYEKLFPVELKALLQYVRDFQQKTVVNDNTVLLRANSWQENLITNLEYMNKDVTIAYLEKKYDCPVVVASGGPSLTKQISLLKQYRDKIVLVAAGSTVNSLLKYDLKPDYVVSIDGHENNLKHFKDLKLEHSTLIYSYFNYPRIRESFETGHYFSHSRGLSDKFLENLFEDTAPLIVGGGTVAHYALSFARYITTSYVGVIGQDLAYTDNKSHAEGNLQNKKINKPNAAHIELEGYYGDMVKSSVSFNSMKVVFEEIITMLEDRDKIFNCTEGGVKIKGMNQLSFIEFLSSYAKSENSIHIDDIKSASKLTDEKISEQLNICEETISLLDEGLKKLRNNNSFNSFDRGTIKKLTKVDEFLVKYQEQLPLEFTMQNIELQFLKRENEDLSSKTTTEVYRATKEQNEAAYEEIRKIIVMYKEKLISIKKVWNKWNLN